MVGRLRSSPPRGAIFLADALTAPASSVGTPGQPFRARWRHADGGLGGYSRRTCSRRASARRRSISDVQRCADSKKDDIMDRTAANTTSWIAFRFQFYMALITRCNTWTQLNTLNPFTNANPCVLHRHDATLNLHKSNWTPWSWLPAADALTKRAVNCVSSFAKRDSTSSSFCSSPLVARSGFAVLEESIDAPHTYLTKHPRAHVRPAEHA